MQTQLMEPPVARPKGRPKRSERDDVAVKIDRAIVTMARRVAESRGIPVAELLSETLRGPIGKMYAQRMRELDRGSE